MGRCVEIPVLKEVTWRKASSVSGPAEGKEQGGQRQRQRKRKKKDKTTTGDGKNEVRRPIKYGFKGSLITGWSL